TNFRYRCQHRNSHPVQESPPPSSGKYGGHGTDSRQAFCLIPTQLLEFERHTSDQRCAGSLKEHAQFASALSFRNARGAEIGRPGPQEQPMMNCNRRAFMSVATIAAGTPAVSALASAEASEPRLPTVLTGNGEWTYEVVPDWGSLPPSTNFGGTHGAIAE